jgi:dTDP-4-amino-4,6-dideoxygalactose transaminase
VRAVLQHFRFPWHHKAKPHHRLEGNGMTSKASKLALFGGPKSVTKEPGDLFTWPIVTKEDEEAVLEVLRRGAMSGNDVSKKFEAEFAEWMGVKHALTFCNGTASLFAALWACGVGAGDEIICPSLTYWASTCGALTLGASVNFADSDPNTLCIDPGDIEHRIGPRTKVIVVVHYAGHPCDMDPIMAIARRHGVKVIEDVSHAQGGLYKGRKLGAIGDIGAMSMMSGKSFACGEAGMIVTDNRLLFERCVALGHYERTGLPSRFNAADSQITEPELTPFAGLPLFLVKHRINQTCSAMGRVQLKYYLERIARIQTALNRFWDLLEGVPGLHAIRPPRDSGSTMGGWYYPQGAYRAAELGGLPVERFCEAVRAEGVLLCNAAAQMPLHLHKVFHGADLFRQGQPTMIAFGQRDVRQGPGSLPVAENARQTTFTIPWFKFDRPEFIREYATAYRKVAEHAAELR